MRISTAFLLLACSFVRAQDSSAPSEADSISAAALEDPAPSPSADSVEPLFDFDLAPYNVAFGIVAEALARLADTGEPLDIPLPLVGPGYYLEIMVRSPKNNGGVPFSQINAVSIEGGLGIPKTQIEIILPGDSTAHQTIMVPGPSEQDSDSEGPASTDEVPAPTDEVPTSTDEVPAPTDEIPPPEESTPAVSVSIPSPTPIDSSPSATPPTDVAATDSAPNDSAPTANPEPTSDEPSAIESPAESDSVPEASSDEIPPPTSGEAPTEVPPVNATPMPNPEASASSQIQEVFSELSRSGILSEQSS
ncbi:hypothetical protein EC988_006056, partial [Linderina pennispora]